MVKAAHKPGSVPVAGYPATGDGHSSSTAVTDGVKQPTRKLGRAVLTASLFGLAPGGVYRALDVAIEPGKLLPHPFTLTRRSGRSALCGTFPGVTPAGCYPAPCPAEPGLSSPRYTGSDHLACFDQANVYEKPASKPLMAACFPSLIFQFEYLFDSAYRVFSFRSKEKQSLAVRTGNQAVYLEQAVENLRRKVHIAPKA